MGTVKDIRIYVNTKTDIFSNNKKSAVFRMLKDNNIYVNYDVEAIKKEILKQLEDTSLRKYNFEEIENEKVINETLMKYI